MVGSCAHKLYAGMGFKWDDGARRRYPYREIRLSGGPHTPTFGPKW